MTEYKNSKKTFHAIQRTIEDYFNSCEQDEILAIFVPFYTSSWSKLLYMGAAFAEMAKATDQLLLISNDLTILFDNAYSKAKLNELDQAELSYRQYLSIKHDNVAVLHNLSLLLERKNQPSEAIELSEKAYAIKPEDKVIKDRFNSFKPLHAFKSLADSTLSNNVLLKKLSLKQKLYLSSVLDCCLSEDQKIICSIDESNKKLAPNEEHERRILKQLWHDNILVIDPYFSRSALSLSKNNLCEANLRQVRWILNVVSEKPISTARLLMELLSPDLLSDENLEEAIDLWREIALEESIEYLQHKRALVNLSVEIAEKTREYFIDLLQRYSTAQMCNIIYNAIKTSVTYQREKSLPNKHAANLVINHCKRYGEHAEAEGWNIKPYHRDFNCAQSVVSQLLFDRLLGIGDIGFNKVPGDYPLLENIA